MNSKTTTFLQGVGTGIILTAVAFWASSPSTKSSVVKIYKVVRGATRNNTKEVEPETNLAGN
jgi:hypothetical protein